ncbi:hypothetical protein KQX54_017845 [Cotesia glomerata]|uniref:Uncharacterized protein n=1 Tax=Cotesia glomerata TaxID=32391 RepID=A0AAV7J8F7_COTGL|nr:hypothetical protein KQX54_017845 [Cotesia glomerata]
MPELRFGARGDEGVLGFPTNSTIPHPTSLHLGGAEGEMKKERVKSQLGDEGYQAVEKNEAQEESRMVGQLSSFRVREGGEDE